jgi:ABC-type Zn uptake system ZnuABC Zn-binding protein ZnuA
MENHFYHFQQSLDHLEALLFSATPEEKANAERNARAFLQRMRRLNEAKGTIANEAQRAASSVHLLGEDPVTKPIEKKDK